MGRGNLLVRPGAQRPGAPGKAPGEATAIPGREEGPPPEGSLEASASPASRRSPAAYLELTKPGIAVFVAITAGVGFYLGARGSPDPLLLVHTLVGVLVATAGSLALNQYVERDRDAVMIRTRGRPLPTGRLQPRQALVFGLVLVAWGTMHLALAVGPVPAALTALSAAWYTLVYTPLKSRSYLATPVGAISGATPAPIGWAAAAGGVSGGAGVLFAIGFLWQLPHVLSLGWNLRHDYARAGFKLIPPSDPGGRWIGSQLVLYNTALVPVSLLPTILGLTGRVYFFGALLLGLLFLSASLSAARRMSAHRARRVFLGSLLYQPALLAMMVMDAVRP